MVIDNKGNPINTILESIKENPDLFISNINEGQVLSITTFNVFKRGPQPMEQYTDRYLDYYLRWVNATISRDKINELNFYLKSINSSVHNVNNENIHANNDFICNAINKCSNYNLTENLSKFVVCVVKFKICFDFKNRLILKINTTVLMLDESYNIYTLEELTSDIMKANSAELIATGPVNNFSTVVF